MKKATLVLVSVLVSSLTAFAGNHSAVHLKAMDAKSASCNKAEDVGSTAYRLNNLQLNEEGEDLVLSFDVSLMKCTFDQAAGFALVANALPTAFQHAVANENGPNLIRYEYSQYQFIIYDQAADLGTAQANRLNTTAASQKVEYVISGGVAAVRSGPQMVSAFMSYYQKTYANGQLIDANVKAGGVFNIQLR